MGDNLGLHSILGFSESFVSNFPCRFCKLTKNICFTATTQWLNSLRNVQNYENHILTNNVSVTGIKGISVWNKINYFHIIDNFAVDIMHDLFEGICTYLVFYKNDSGIQIFFP